jgi:hypothetical protein
MRKEVEVRGNRDEIETSWRSLRSRLRAVDVVDGELWKSEVDLMVEGWVKSHWTGSEGFEWIKSHWNVFRRF